MNVIKNPAWSRPLSANVKRLMRMSRTSPKNPDVAAVPRAFTSRDMAYCDMQGNIFMAAVDRNIPMSVFAPVYMTSQLAGVVDYSFACSGGMEGDEISNFLRIPMLLKSPTVIVDTVMWLDKIVRGVTPGGNINLAVLHAMENDEENQCDQHESSQHESSQQQAGDITAISDPDMATFSDAASTADTPPSPDKLLTEYEYAYWLGYMYRCECLMHDESSRMVYGAFHQDFMRAFYDRLTPDDDADLVDCAPELCRRLDSLILAKL